MGKIADFIFLPLRVLLPHDIVRRIGLTSLEQERINAVRRHIRGSALDIACGRDNALSRLSQKRVFGLDIRFYPALDIQADSQTLPLKDRALANVVVLSSLDYIADKTRALDECRRVLKDGGKIFITTINPVFCYIRWKLAVWNRYKNPKRGGFWKREIKELFKKSNFRLVGHERFVYGLNNLYIGEKI